MIKDVGSKFDDYSISSKVRQILLHWGYELTGKRFFLLTQQILICSYYQFNRQKIFQKAKERYSKEKAADYYLKSKEAIKENLKNNTKTYLKKKKIILKSIKEKHISN